MDFLNKLVRLKAKHVRKDKKWLHRAYHTGVELPIFIFKNCINLSCEYLNSRIYETSFSPIAALKIIAIKKSLFQSLDSPYKTIPSSAPPAAPIPVQIA